MKKKRLSFFHMVLIVALVGLGGANLYKHRESLNIPGLGTSIDSLLSEVDKLERKLSVKRDNVSKEKSKLNKLKRLASNLWLSTGSTPTLSMRSAINSAAQKAQVSRSSLSMGSARKQKESEHIDKVEFHVRTMLPMKDISRFLKEVEALRPRAFWGEVSLRPNSTTNPSKVSLSGRLVFYALDKKASRFIKSGSGGEK